MTEPEGVGAKELTLERIEHWRELLLITKWTPGAVADINQLCDMAIRSERLSAELADAFEMAEQSWIDKGIASLLSQVGTLERELAAAKAEMENAETHRDKARRETADKDLAIGALAASVKRRAEALIESEDEDHKMLGEHYDGLADEILHLASESRAASLQSALTEAEGRIREECAKACYESVRLDVGLNGTIRWTVLRPGQQDEGWADPRFACATAIRALAVSKLHTERPAGYVEVPPEGEK